MTSTETVRDLMVTGVRTLRRNDRLKVADELMRKEAIRHLPVLDDDDRLCGIVTRTDIFRGALLRALGYGERAEDKMLESVAVKEVMTQEVSTIGPEEPVREAARRMLELRCGCLPVVDGTKLIGILTETDLLKTIA